MRFVFATNNEHKVEEIRFITEGIHEIISLKEAGISIDIPEPHATLEENASEKTKTIYELTGENCISEDTGLEVAALNGEPGVQSARYAGESKSFEKNIEKLLMKLEPHSNKKARFRTIISLIVNGKEWQFEGICEGSIIPSPRGDKGFGYDPIFVPDGETRTFAEMSLKEKTQYSHRTKATDKLVAFLQKLEVKSQN